MADVGGTERLLQDQARRLSAEAEARQDAEDARIVRIMRAVAVEEVSQVREAMLTREDVAAGFVDGMRRLLQDDELVRDFWAAGFAHLADRGSESAMRWVGRRVLISAAGVLLAAAVYLAAKLGTLK